MSPALLSIHGGLLDEELSRMGISEGDVLDFSVNVNPYGPPEEVLQAIRGAPVSRYPDPTAARARQSLGAALDVPSECVVLSNGAVDALWATARALLRPGDTVLIAEPAFSEMRAAAELVGARVAECRASAEEDFAFDAERFSRSLARARPRLAYIATPANPSGVRVPEATLVALAEAFPDTQFVVDLSFLALSSGPNERIVHASPRILWVRSLTKELSVPGTRVGFAVGQTELIAKILRQTPPWSVSAPAQAVAHIALSTGVRAFVEASRRRLLADRANLETELVALGLTAHRSDTVYVLVELGGRRRATELREALLCHSRVLVRDGSSFGLPQHLRIAARPLQERARLITALQKELGT